MYYCPTMTELIWKFAELMTSYLMDINQKKLCVIHSYNLCRPNILDELEGKKYIYESAKSSHHSRRPMSAAAAYHAYEPLGRLRTGSIEVSPRSAWGDQITPVNLPHSSTETRPDSAPIGRSSSRRMRTPTPVDLETGLKVGDPALPLIQAIKEELRRFKSSVNTNTSDA